MSTGQYTVYWILALTLMAGFWLVFGIVATELKRWREWRLRGTRSAEPPIVVRPHQKPAAISEKHESAAVRGFDSPELFCEDTLDRIRHLDEQIATYLCETERRRGRKA